MSGFEFDRSGLTMDSIDSSTGKRRVYPTEAAMRVTYVPSHRHQWRQYLCGPGVIHHPPSREV
jgi:hypothetical protein